MALEPREPDEPAMVLEGRDPVADDLRGVRRRGTNRGTKPLERSPGLARKPCEIFVDFVAEPTSSPAGSGVS